LTAVSSTYSIDPYFATGGALFAPPSTVPHVQVPETLRTAAGSFETDSNTVSAGYIDIEHTLEPDEIRGATFEFI